MIFYSSGVGKKSSLALSRAHFPCQLISPVGNNRMFMPSSALTLTPCILWCGRSSSLHPFAFVWIDFAFVLLNYCLICTVIRTDIVLTLQPFVRIRKCVLCHFMSSKKLITRLLWNNLWKYVNAFRREPKLCDLFFFCFFSKWILHSNGGRVCFIVKSDLWCIFWSMRCKHISKSKKHPLALYSCNMAKQKSQQHSLIFIWRRKRI